MTVYIKLDERGRALIPAWAREKYELSGLEIREEQGKLIIEPIESIGSPIDYLSKYSIKTKDTPKQMKKMTQKIMEESA